MIINEVSYIKDFSVNSDIVGFFGVVCFDFSMGEGGECVSRYCGGSVGIGGWEGVWFEGI